MTIAGAALLLVLAVLALLYDRLRARESNRRFVMSAFMEKALADRTHMVRIPAEQVKKLFRLENRALPNPAQFNEKPGAHPAVRRKRKP